MPKAHLFSKFWANYGPFGRQDVHFHPCVLDVEDPSHDCARVLEGDGRHCNGIKDGHREIDLDHPTPVPARAIRHGDKQPWDADCDATRAGMERFLRALVVCGGHYTDSFTLVKREEITKPSRCSVFFRIWLPPGAEVRFAEMAKCEVKPIPKVSVGLTVGDE